MSFTVEEFHDLVRLLDREPTWRGELRRLLLTDELLELPQITRELVEAQRRTDERLTETQRRTDERFAELVAAQRHTEAALQTLTARAEALTVVVGHLKGSDVERRYRERAPAYFAPILRRIHALSTEELAAMLDELEARAPLDERDRAELLAADLVVRGVQRADGAETYLVVEISAGIGLYDVERACERARVLQRVTRKPAVGVVAGETITAEAEDAARRLHAWHVLDGRATAPS